MRTFTIAEINKIPSKTWATEGDTLIGNTEYSGHDPSSEAIGGYYGISWYEVFQDKNGELYVVRCYDGTNRSKPAHKPEDWDKPWKEYAPRNRELKFSLGDVFKNMK
jgi:hypothetical protein